MHKSKRKDSYNISKKPTLISEFLEQSSFVKSGGENKQYISQVRTSTQFLYIGPEINAKAYNMFEANQTELFQSFGIESDKSDKNQRMKLTHNEDLKQSFVKSQIDNTTYESLMNEFMGSYLEQRLQQQQSQNYQRTFTINNKNSSSPMNSFNHSDSQITFSGETKQSRIINHNEESRIVKDEYFLLDQLKKSKKEKSVQYPSSHKKLKSRRQNLIEESYQLKSPTSSSKMSQSRQKSEEQKLGRSNGKTKIQHINLVKELKNKKNFLKLPYQKYEISKKTLSPTKNNPSLKLSVNKKINNQQDKQSNLAQNDKIICNMQKPFQNIPENKNPNSSQGLSIINKKSKLNKSLNSLKTFHLSSNKAHNLSRVNKITSINQNSQQKSFDHQYSHNKQQNTQLGHKLASSSQKQNLQKKNSQRFPQPQYPPHKYIYQYSYKIDQDPQNYSDQFIEKINFNSKKDPKQDLPKVENHVKNDTATQFKKDREMIREIKKDLTKLIQKITISKT